MYIGHYVPNLALAITRHNDANAGAHINLQGFLAGNAWTGALLSFCLQSTTLQLYKGRSSTKVILGNLYKRMLVCLCADASLDNLGAVYFWHSHALVSDATKDGLLAKCNFSTVGPLQVHIEDSGKVCYPLQPRLELPNDGCLYLQSASLCVFRPGLVAAVPCAAVCTPYTSAFCYQPSSAWMHSAVASMPEQTQLGTQQSCGPDKGISGGVHAAISDMRRLCDRQPVREWICHRGGQHLW